LNWENKKKHERALLIANNTLTAAPNRDRLHHPLDPLWAPSTTSVAVTHHGRKHPDPLSMSGHLLNPPLIALGILKVKIEK
jgi:hypothetical protein